VDNKKRNKLRNLRRQVAAIELAPPRATYRNTKKLERRRKALIRYYQAKAAAAGIGPRPAPAPEPQNLFSQIGAAMRRQVRKRLEARA